MRSTARGAALWERGELAGDLEHELAEPAVGWVFAEARVPEHGDRVLGDLEWHRAGRELRRGGAVGEARGRGQHKVTLREDFECGREVGDAEGDAAFETSLRKHAVDDAGAFATRGDEDVVEGGVALEREALGVEHGVALAHEALKRVAEERATL